MVSKKLVKALNEHINLEMYSGYLYLAMSIKTHEENYKGYSSWLFKQYQEEFEHSHDFIHFMQQRDMSVELKPVQVEPIKETDQYQGDATLRQAVQNIVLAPARTQGGCQSAEGEYKQDSIILYFHPVALLLRLLITGVAHNAHGTNSP